MRLLRPYIPLAARIVVAERMNNEKYGTKFSNKPRTKSGWLKWLLKDTFGDQNIQLDHDPALENRIKIRDKNGFIVGYEPDANDPRFLIYREKHAHHIKTNVRGDGAQYPDRVLANRERARNRKKRKYNWPSRPFPKRKKKW